MIVLLTGPSHVGKTVMAQRILEAYHLPYLSLDLLKMGLIRSGQTDLTPQDDEALVEYLWPIAREIVKTALENGQHLVVEGCYIPWDWAEDFTPEQRGEMRFCCLVMSPAYIRGHFVEILRHASDVEKRLEDSSCTVESVLEDNRIWREQCQRHGYPFTLIEEEYPAGIPWDLKGAP